MLRFQFWVLRFRFLGASFSRFECSVFEFWVLRFRVLGASFSRFGCSVFEIWVLCALVFVFERFVFETTVQTPPDLLERICRVNLSNAKQFGLICFPRICFRGLIYCDLECDRRCLLFFGCTCCYAAKCNN